MAQLFVFPKSTIHCVPVSDMCSRFKFWYYIWDFPERLNFKVLFLLGFDIQRQSLKNSQLVHYPASSLN